MAYDRSDWENLSDLEIAMLHMNDPKVPYGVWSRALDRYCIGQTINLLASKMHALDHHGPEGNEYRKMQSAIEVLEGLGEGIAK